jgi:lipopolysaccharide export system protein LptA
LKVRAGFLLGRIWPVFFIGLYFAAPAAAQNLEGKISDIGPGAMVIHSKTLELDDAAKVVTFTGNVEAKKGDFLITCQKMQVFYKKAPQEQSSEDVESGIDRILAIGGVKIERAQGGIAMAEKAVYYQTDDKAVLTGSPVVKQGKDFVEGDRITIFLSENRSVVESKASKKVRAIIFPKDKQR